MSNFACDLCEGTISDNDECHNVYGTLICENCFNLIKSCEDKED